MFRDALDRYERLYNTVPIEAKTHSSVKLFYRHAVVAFLAVGVYLAFWLGRPEWTPEMRLWRAIGDVSFVFLFLVLALGPAARHWPAVTRLLSWRRELGIWFAILALAHTLLVLDGWVRWDWMRFFGYEFLEQLGRYARVEPGFGLSNLIGVVAAVMAVPLMITSSSWTVKRLGGSSWKWLHIGAYTIFYLVVLHSLYFLFMHYTISFHRAVPDPNWFRYPFLITALLVLGMQMSAFVSTVRKRTVTRRGG
jgi:sulfoxide reductase heme-binding subunit YedZ